MTVAETMTADVVVVTWRSGERVLRCLERLAQQQPAARTVVVDNASSDGTVTGIRERFPDVRVLELSENRGFGSAVNAGAATADGAAIVLVNDDVEVGAGCIPAMLAPLEEQRSCGMVAGMTMLPDSDNVDGYGIELDCTLAAYNRLRNRLPDERPGRLAMPSGGLAAYRRAAFEQVGGFDERLFAYGEDVDLGLRMLLAGWTAAAAPQAGGGCATLQAPSRSCGMWAATARQIRIARTGRPSGPRSGKPPDGEQPRWERTGRFILSNA